MKSACEILSIASVCLVIGVAGCSNKDTPAPPVVENKPAQPKVDPVPPAVAITPVQPKVQPASSQAAPKVDNAVERSAAEWLLRTNRAMLRIVVDGEQRELKKVDDLPQTNFTVAEVFFGGNDSDLEQLQGLTHLTKLYLYDTPYTDRGVAHLRGLTELIVLDLNRTKITDAGLEQLKGMTKLAQLMLSGVPITDAGVAHLKGFKGLNMLYLTGAKLTDAGVAELKGLTGMVYLHLEDTPVTDACLVHLKELKNLEFLGLNGTHVTDAGIAEIKAALPKCNVQK